MKVKYCLKVFRPKESKGYLNIQNIFTETLCNKQAKSLKHTKFFLLGCQCKKGKRDHAVNYNIPHTFHLWQLGCIVLLKPSGTLKIALLGQGGMIKLKNLIIFVGLISSYTLLTIKLTDPV